jgi:predicted esterase
MRMPLIVWLHGLGDTGMGWSFLKHELGFKNARYLFPDAPVNPVSCNGGFQMTSWMDLDTIPVHPKIPDDKEVRRTAPSALAPAVSAAAAAAAAARARVRPPARLTRPRPLLCAGVLQGLAASSRIIHELLDREVAAGTPSEDIVLGGFSQGGAMALLAGYSYPKKLAGVACLSGWAAMRDDLAPRVSGGANAATPAFIAHGEADGVVLPQCGKEANELLSAAGVPTKFETYRGMEHSSCEKEMSDLHAWLRTVVPAVDA